MQVISELNGKNIEDVIAQGKYSLWVSQIIASATLVT